MVSCKLIVGAVLASSSVATTASSGSSLVWRWRNYANASPVSPVDQPVTIHVPPDTDIWRPAPDRNNFTAPFLYTTVPAASFLSARVTVAAPWRTLYDQGGLVLAFPSREAFAARSIKAGIEFTDGAPALGVVGTDTLSDWSLSPLLERQTGGNQTATVTIERQGTDAWVYVLEDGGRTRRQLRQVTWAFSRYDGRAGQMVHVGIYGAKPTRESPPSDPLTKLPVSLFDFELVLKK
ncbi:hypothetical protein ISF_04852 [Cordyceps fumosorosea ARSEF 2679]|uniref:Concanavalin A-like lectin/glucanase n=1 Tax=Cordyceps fumosorosea (strain ARSEF 2679) TaxID=1081104 RepID=A0A167VTX0_CORFA|nr:hypothetical protein ISF_04852 [Cordyceps fumosorosea ARSEF 2679]OAA62976.1 hypothetical protein ISF_04852 [Cordyceps fumosorosea ARSEF 2679]